MRLNTELLRFEQNAAGVVAFLRKRDGSEYPLRATYLIAADGHRSPLRKDLGIDFEGRGHMRTVTSVMFRALLEEYLAK